MTRDALLARVLATVDRRAYLTPTAAVAPAMRAALDEVRAALGRPGFDAEAVRALVESHHAAGRIDDVRRLSALCVIASHPRVADWPLAARLCGEHEIAVLAADAPSRDADLAAVARHRGVIAFQLGQPDVALDHFLVAFERHRTPENLGNVLAALLRQGALDEADRLLDGARASLPAPFVAELDAHVASDPDLAALRSRESA